MNLTLILVLIIKSSVSIGKNIMISSGKYTGSFSSLLILAILTIFLLLAILFDEDFEIIRLVQAESDNDSDSDKLPRKDKGKGKATESEYVDLSPSPYSSNDELAKDNANVELKKQQEDNDYKLAKILQEEEDVNNTNVNSESESGYSVVSSEIHTDDSENTVNKKLAVMQYDNDPKNKRKRDSESDNENPERKYKKILPKE